MPSLGHELGSRARRSAIWLGALALLVAAFAALGGGAQASGGIAQASKSAGVRIANFAFHPGTLNVPKGSTVAWSNASGVSHTATGSNFDTGVIKPGKSISVRFGKKGTFAYHCEIHPEMHGRIVVG